MDSMNCRWHDAAGIPEGDDVTDRLSRLATSWRPRVEAAVAWLHERGYDGEVGLILGSGLGNFVEAITDSRACEFADVPGFATPSVQAHQGRLVRGRAGKVRVIVMQGRLHPYEGLPFDALLLPTAVLACLNVATVVVTNAAGGLNRFYRPGDLMVIRDQLDLHLHDPLRGLLGDPPAGERSRPVGNVFDPELARRLAAVGAEIGVPLHSGTYASVWGPAYETKAEIGLLKRIGCDAVGMSTTPETVLLAGLGVKVVGLSCITNPSREVGQPELLHEDVVEVGRMVREKMARLLMAFLPRLAPSSG
jgi:purine-nucleoside phosphorylase